MAFRLIPDDTRIQFQKYQYVAYAASLLLIILTCILVPVRGMELGIDFQGGTIIEVRMPAAPDLAAMRANLGGLDLGEIALQEFGAPTDILIRVQRQAGGEEAQLAAVNQVKAALEQEFGTGISYRRVEFVGPKVSSDLFWAGTQAVIWSIVTILIYIWFRFEWQYGIGCVFALVHDAVTTVGLYSLFGLEFNLTSIAAILTIVGYSLNDTVVIFDRVRENLRRYKSMPMPELIDRSINETLARTVMTTTTTVLALLALLIFGGPVLRDFSIAMLWGIAVGTYSTIYVATPILVHLNLRGRPQEGPSKPSPATP